MDDTLDRSSSEEAPFLDSVEKGNPKSLRTKLRSRKRSILGFAALQLSLIAIYTAVFLLYAGHVRSHRATHDPAGVMSDGLDHLKIAFEQRKYIAYQDSPYAGTPDVDSNEVWNRLITNKTVRVSQEELLRKNQTSIGLPQGGYMAWLSVFHELHCLHMIRKHLYNGLSNMDGTEAEKHHEEVHMNHCIEMLRSSTVCRADASVITFKWGTQGKPMPDLQRPVHTCVNWGSFMNSLQTRFVDEDELLQLISTHP